MSEVEQLQSNAGKLELLKRLIDEVSIPEKSIEVFQGNRNELSEQLVERYSTLKEKHEFNSGQLVTWKPGMKNKKRPLYGEPAIVIEVLSEPIYGDQQSPGSAYYREPLDLLCAFIDSDDDFVIFHLDSRRMMPVS